MRRVASQLELVLFQSSLQCNGKHLYKYPHITQKNITFQIFFVFYAKMAPETRCHFLYGCTKTVLLLPIIRIYNIKLSYTNNLIILEQFAFSPSNIISTSTKPWYFCLPVNYYPPLAINL